MFDFATLAKSAKAASLNIYILFYLILLNLSTFLTKIRYPLGKNYTTTAPLGKNKPKNEVPIYSAKPPLRFMQEGQSEYIGTSFWSHPFSF